MFEKQQKLLGKFLSFGSKPSVETFPELPECLTWFRFLLAINYGIYMGLTELDNKRGAMPLLMALNFLAFGPMMYTMLILQADNDSYGGKLLFSGLANGMALVLLIWIYFYTMAFEDEEQKLSSLLELVKASTMSQGDDGDGGEGDPAGGLGQDASVPPPMEESEF